MVTVLCAFKNPTLGVLFSLFSLLRQEDTGKHKWKGTLMVPPFSLCLGLWQRPIDGYWHWCASFLWVVDWHPRGWGRLRQRSTLPGSPYFQADLCQLLAGTHPRFCSSSRQASNDEHTGMQSHVRKSSNLKDLECHQIPTTATLPSVDPASPKHCHILRQPIPYLDSSNF